jgi:hypothetical protein
LGEIEIAFADFYDGNGRKTHLRYSERIELQNSSYIADDTAEVAYSCCTLAKPRFTCEKCANYTLTIIV